MRKTKKRKSRRKAGTLTLKDLPMEQKILKRINHLKSHPLFCKSIFNKYCYYWSYCGQ